MVKTRTKNKKEIRRLNLICLLIITISAIALLLIPSVMADDNDLPHRMAKQVLGSSSNIVAGALGLDKDNANKLDPDSDIKALESPKGSVFDAMNTITDGLLHTGSNSVLYIRVENNSGHDRGTTEPVTFTFINLLVRAIE